MMSPIHRWRLQLQQKNFEDLPSFLRAMRRRQETDFWGDLTFHQIPWENLSDIADLLYGIAALTPSEAAWRCLWSSISAKYSATYSTFSDSSSVNWEGVIEEIRPLIQCWPDILRRPLLGRR